MADFEGIARMKLKIMDTENPEKRKVFEEKLEKLKKWEHPRVSQKMTELKCRGMIG